MQTIHLGHRLEDLYKCRNAKRLFSSSFEYKILEGNFGRVFRANITCVNNTNPTEGAKCTEGLERWQRLSDYSQAYILLPKSESSPPSEEPIDQIRNGQLTRKPTVMPSLITKSPCFPFYPTLPFACLIFLMHLLFLFSVLPFPTY